MTLTETAVVRAALPYGDDQITPPAMADRITPPFYRGVLPAAMRP